MFIWLLAGLAVFVLGVFLLTALTGAPYVPTHRQEARASFSKLRPLTKKDVVLDIGSGDGVVLQEIVAQGAYAVGYEINIFLVWISRWRLRRHKNVRIECRNLWTTTFPSQVSVVYVFGDSRDIEKMYRKVQQEATRLERPIDLVSYGFTLPGVQAEAAHRAHTLYRVSPLQSMKP